MKRELWKRFGFGAAVAAVVLYSLAPFAWIVITSLKTPKEIAERPPTLWPETVSAASYRLVQKEHNITGMVVNSAVVSAGTTLVVIPVAAMAAYALARLRFRGRAAILALILSASMFPQVTIAHAIYRMLQGLGWLNAYQGLIVPYVSLTLPLAVWILATFFRGIPRDLEEAAKVDGCGTLRRLFSVFLPIAAPGLFTAAILTFIYAWNEFFFALIVMTDQGMQTLPRGIALMPGRYTMPWGEIAAASVVTTLPLVVFVLVLQRRIISGLTAGAVKG